jgi:hypothetical protein
VDRCETAAEEGANIQQPLLRNGYANENVSAAIVGTETEERVSCALNGDKLLDGEVSGQSDCGME